MTRILAVVAAACALAGCSRGEPKPAVPPPPAFDTSIDVQELMVHVVDPAAFAFWAGAGTVVTEAGEQDLSPTTEAGWKKVEDGAATVAEAGNMLLLPGRKRDDAAWAKYARQLTQAALAGKRAAEAKDKQAVFDTGGKLYEVCTACHQRYIAGEGTGPAPEAGK